MLQPLGFELHLFFEQVPFLTQSLGGILGQDCQTSGGIRQTAS